MTNFERLLYEWYHLNGRDLPWRHTTDPYQIWISEVILQQTQVVQGLDYYNRFLERFPDVQALADSSQDDVLKAWQGLGYYSRARNAHAAARIIVAHYNGVFPSDYNLIRALPGIGDYTAAAIASFCFRLPHAVVDGNVFRFFARFFAIDTPIDTGAGKKVFFAKANELLDRKQPHLFNQAVMEFGNLVCTPSNPGCTNCPFHHQCQAYSLGRVLDLPVKAKRMERKIRFLHYFIFDLPNGKTLIERRNHRDIWHGLHQFPLMEVDRPVDETAVYDFLRLEFPGAVFQGQMVGRRKHLLTHQELHVSFWRFWVEGLDPKPSQLLVSWQDIPKFAFPQLIVAFLEDCPND